MDLRLDKVAPPLPASRSSRPSNFAHLNSHPDYSKTDFQEAHGIRERVHDDRKLVISIVWRCRAECGGRIKWFVKGTRQMVHAT